MKPHHKTLLAFGAFVVLSLVGHFTRSAHGAEALPPFGDDVAACMAAMGQPPTASKIMEFCQSQVQETRETATRKSTPYKPLRALLLWEACMSARITATSNQRPVAETVTSLQGKCASYAHDLALLVPKTDGAEFEAYGPQWRTAVTDMVQAHRRATAR